MDDSLRDVSCGFPVELSTFDVVSALEYAVTMAFIFLPSRIVGTLRKKAIANTLRSLFHLALLLGTATVTVSASPVHIWEKEEVKLIAEHSYRNPYTEVTVWVDLSGPGFHKRVYGFWDGG